MAVVSIPLIYEVAFCKILLFLNMSAIFVEADYQLQHSGNAIAGNQQDNSAMPV